jgi:hypothetical protein
MTERGPSGATWTHTLSLLGSFTHSANPKGKKRFERPNEIATCQQMMQTEAWKDLGAGLYLSFGLLT